MSRAGTIVDSGTQELGEAQVASSFSPCSPADSDEPVPPQYETDVTFLTADDFEPAAVRVVVSNELPRYASLPVPAVTDG